MIGEAQRVLACEDVSERARAFVYAARRLGVDDPEVAHTFQALEAALAALEALEATDPEAVTRPDLTPIRGR